METSRDGVFACGNTVHIHDLVDWVSQESQLAGRGRRSVRQGRRRRADNVQLVPGINVRSCVPHTISTEREHTVFLRVTKSLAPCTLRLGDAYERPLRYVVPGEMVTVKVRPVPRGLPRRQPARRRRAARGGRARERDEPLPLHRLPARLPARGRHRGDDIVEVRGHACKRGEVFALQEHVDPAAS
jgi:hypothetical protein